MRWNVKTVCFVVVGNMVILCYFRIISVSFLVACIVCLFESWCIFNCNFQKIIQNESSLDHPSL